METFALTWKLKQTMRAISRRGWLCRVCLPHSLPSPLPTRGTCSALGPTACFPHSPIKAPTLHWPHCSLPFPQGSQKKAWRLMPQKIKVFYHSRTSAPHDKPFICLRSSQQLFSTFMSCLKPSPTNPGGQPCFLDLVTSEVPNHNPISPDGSQQGLTPFLLMATWPLVYRPLRWQLSCQ